MGSNKEQIRKIVSDVSIPVQVAGGLRDEQTINETLNFASRIVLGTIAIKNKNALQTVLKKHGKEKIVISTDYLD